MVTTEVDSSKGISSLGEAAAGHDERDSWVVWVGSCDEEVGRTHSFRYGIISVWTCGRHIAVVAKGMLLLIVA
jgi:hypothetical protein